MPLQFLEFDLSEDTDGLSSWDALASPAARHTPELLAEVRDLLDQLHQALGPSGPVTDGHRWDLDLQIHDEQGHPVALESLAHPLRITLALSLTGDNALSAELAARMRL
jgi:DNA-binding GntR family transcriptional regulator